MRWVGEGGIFHDSLFVADFFSNLTLNHTVRASNGLDLDQV